MGRTPKSHTGTAVRWQSLLKSVTECGRGRTASASSELVHGSGTAACGLELDGLLRRGRCSRAGAFQVVDKHVADRPDRLLEKLVAEALEGVKAF